MVSWNSKLPSMTRPLPSQLGFTPFWPLGWRPRLAAMGAVARTSHSMSFWGVACCEIETVHTQTLPQRCPPLTTGGVWSLGVRGPHLSIPAPPAVLHVACSNRAGPGVDPSNASVKSPRDLPQGGWRRGRLLHDWMQSNRVEYQTGEVHADDLIGMSASSFSTPSEGPARCEGITELSYLKHMKACSSTAVHKLMKHKAQLRKDMKRLKGLHTRTSVDSNMPINPIQVELPPIYHPHPSPT